MIGYVSCGILTYEGSIIRNMHIDPRDPAILNVAPPMTHECFIDGEIGVVLQNVMDHCAAFPRRQERHRNIVWICLLVSCMFLHAHWRR